MRLYARTYKRLSLSLTNRASAMATKLLASKATVEHRMYKFSSTEGSVWRFSHRILEQFWLRISCEIFRLFVGLGECTRVENWNMLFCVTCSNALQLRSDPEVLFTLPSWSSCRGQSVITPPPPLFIASHGTTQKTKPQDVEVTIETSWPFFGFWTSGSDASGRSAQVAALL